MKRHNRLMAILAALVAAAMLLAACSVQAPSNQIGKDEGLEAPAATQAPAAAPGEGAKADDGGTLPVVDPGSAANYGKKIIYTVNMQLEAGDAARAVNDISAAAAELGGYVSAMQYDENSHTGWITVRIVPEKLVQFTKTVGGMGKMLGQTMSSQDVTDSYYDVESRLKNAEYQEQQLLDIMKKAVKVDDILKVRQELNAVQQEIEQLKGQIRLMDNQVGFSTVTIQVQQPKPPAVTVDPDAGKGEQFWGFAAIWQKVSRGASDSFNWTLNAIAAVFIGVSYVIVPLALAAVVVLAILFIVKAANKKKKKT